jgi:hypothetical protein
MNENQLEQYLFQETEELMSYSSSFEARSRDRFVVFINELFELGSHKEYNTMFHSDRVVLENKSRRLMDYLEVESFIDRIEIVSLNEEVTRFTTKLIKEEKGFDNISFDEVKSKITVLLPPLSVNALLELKGAVNGKVDSYSKSVGMLRSQSAQQVKAGIDNEYIFPPDAAKVAKEIDLIGSFYRKNAKIFGIAKKTILLPNYKPEDDEEVELLEFAPEASLLLGKSVD